MRILQIGQLPKEMGGNYTTGVSRVVGELSKHKFGAHDVFLYGTNISTERAHILCSYKNQFMGYQKRPIHILGHLLLHPITSIKEFCTYRQTDKASFLHMEFIRDNFSRVIEVVNPDLIHYHGAALSALHYANIKKHIPVLYSPHGIMWVTDEGGDADYERRYNATQLTLSFGDFYTALNESVEKRLSLFGVARQKVFVVPNGVDTQKFYFSESARAEIRDSFGIGDSTFVFVTVGLVIDRKGQLLFLQLLESLGIDYQYWIIGKGPDEKKIQQFVNENNIGDKVRLFGYVNDKDIYKYHSAADFYALGSSEEAQSLAEIEAYACGLRIIVNRIVAETVIGDVDKESNRYYVLDFDRVEPEILKRWINRDDWIRPATCNIDWSDIALHYADCYQTVYNQISKTRKD